MIQTEKGAQRSYTAHEQHMINLKDQKDTRFFTLKNKNCVEYIVNIQSLAILEPLLKKKNTWLTIGDYNGFEAQYFMEHNQKVIASDIADVFLKESKAEGFIDEYRKENVEHLSFEDDSMDYVSCREAFHHFPRAYLGLYEMVRVAKKAAIIIEPVDILLKMPLVLFIKNFCDRFHPLLINKIWKNRFSWEVVGNYVFKISEREVEKMAMGIGLPCIAFRGINVLLNIKEDMRTVPTNKTLLNKINRRIASRNFLCKLKLIPYNSLCSILFKEMPDSETIKDLEKYGYSVIKLPVNPYLNKDS